MQQSGKEEKENIKPRFKRRRADLENQLRDGIKNPPKMTEQIKPCDGWLTFSAPSNQQKNIQHKVTIFTSNRTLSYDELNSGCKQFLAPNLVYECSCNNKMSSFGVCKHIKSVILFMTIDLLKNQDQTDQTMELLDVLNRFNIVDDLMISSQSVMDQQ
jgi:hypothetical protein